MAVPHTEADIREDNHSTICSMPRYVGGHARMVLSAQYKRSRGADGQPDSIMSAQHQLRLPRVITAESCGAQECDTRKTTGKNVEEAGWSPGEADAPCTQTSRDLAPTMQYCTLVPVFCKVPFDFGYCNRVSLHPIFPTWPGALGGKHPACWIQVGVAQPYLERLYYQAIMSGPATPFKSPNDGKQVPMLAILIHSL